MLIGKHYHSLESKGRLAIPPVFRTQLGSKPIVTRGLDGCLFLVPGTTWQKLIANLRGSPLTKQDTREYIRLVAHDASIVRFDPQGRTLIPKVLRNYAKITKKVVIAGSLDWIEIWDEATYHQKIEKTEKQAEQVAERLSEITKNE